MEINTEFQGPVAVFPLPNVVLFPGTRLPLHIYEPRYRRMVADALQAERLIVMALLAPGWEADYEGAPPVHAIGTLSRIVQHQPLAGGRSNILLEGLARIRLQHELPADPYRRASVTVLDDHLTTETLPQASRLARQVDELLQQMMLVALELVGITPPLPGEVLSPARYFDKATHALRIDPRLKQIVLDELDVLRRGQRLKAILEQVIAAATARPEPPVKPGGQKPRLN